MRTEVSYVLGPEGPFAALPTYERRDGQMEYARMVEHAIGSANPEGYPLLAEGPTGTGKSLGYLLPCIGNILTRRRKQVDGGGKDVPEWMTKRRLVVVTGNIALQEQLVEKDLPFIRDTTGWQFDWVLLKGRSNYACNRTMSDLDVTKKGLFEDELEAEMVRLKAWYERTKTGDKSEVDPAPSGIAWSMATSSSDDCAYKKCAFFEECHYYGQRRRAREVEVIVTNYHFLLTEIKLRMDLGAPAVLMPEFDLIVCDEAHNMGEIARRFFAEELRATQVKNIGRLLKGKRLKMEKEAEVAFALARDMNQWGRDHMQAFRGNPCFNPARYERYREELTAGMTAVSAGVDEAVKQYCRDNDIVGVSVTDLPELHQKVIESMRRPGTMAKSYVAMIDKIFPPEDQIDHEDTVYFVDKQGFKDSETFSWVACPYKAGVLLKEALWDQCERVILTSATLASDLDAGDGQSKFQFSREELGLHESPCHEIVVESPFDKQANMGVFIEAELDPTNRTHDGLADRIWDLIQCSRGRALVLFTSYAAMNGVYRLLRDDCNRMGWTPMLQGDRSRTQLTRAFRQDVHSVLFATRSFFEGVDVRGDSCSLVILDKIPFPGVGDPFISHQKTKGIGGKWGWFMGQSVPRALMAFRQAEGRLIRAKTDRGVFAILDSRIAVGGKGYGSKFRAAIPSQQYLATVDDVEQFYGVLSGAPSEPPAPPPPPMPHTPEAEDIPF